MQSLAILSLSSNTISVEIVFMYMDLEQCHMRHQAKPEPNQTSICFNIFGSFQFDFKELMERLMERVCQGPSENPIRMFLSVRWCLSV